MALKEWFIEIFKKTAGTGSYLIFVVEKLVQNFKFVIIF